MHYCLNVSLFYESLWTPGTRCLYNFWFNFCTLMIRQFCLIISLVGSLKMSFLFLRYFEFFIETMYDLRSICFLMSPFFHSRLHRLYSLASPHLHLIALVVDMQFGHSSFSVSLGSLFSIL